MAEEDEQVVKDQIMINQQHVYLKLSLPPSLTFHQCINSFLWPAANLWAIVPAARLRGKHKSTSPLLNARAHQGQHPGWTEEYKSFFEALSSGLQPEGFPTLFLNLMTIVLPAARWNLIPTTVVLFLSFGNVSVPWKEKLERSTANENDTSLKI